ncbi:MAG: DUF488 domain-containing protein [Chryseosolibacter sp.]
MARQKTNAVGWFEFCAWGFMQAEKTIWTIGHSTRSWEEFGHLLLMHRIQLLVDIRAFPGSRRHPQFNKEILSASLIDSGIGYTHMPGLGGRRKPRENSSNTAWRHAAFRGYADYMQTTEFKNEVSQLEMMATKERTAYMCSEAPWWKCHRALVSDFLKTRGWGVWHIMEKGKLTEHPFTSPARPVQGELFYGG